VRRVVENNIIYTHVSLKIVNKKETIIYKAMNISINEN